MLTLDGLDDGTQEKVNYFGALPIFQVKEADPCWLRSQNLTLWKNNFFVTAAASSLNYGLFAEWAYRYAELLIEQKGMTGEIGASFIPPKAKKYDVKMRAALLLVVPDKVKNKSLRQDNATVIDMLVDLISGVNPAVKSELDSLKSFTANPGTANTAAEAEEKLVHWQSARKRLIQLGATDVATSGCCWRVVSLW